MQEGPLSSTITDKCHDILWNHYQNDREWELAFPSLKKISPSAELLGIHFDPEKKIIAVDYLQKNKRFSIKGRVIPKVKVMALSYPHEREQLICDKAIEEIYIEKSKLTPQYATTKEELVGYVSTASRLDSGKPIVKTHLKKPLCVRRGDTVRVSYQKHMIYLTMKAQALKDGRLGDMIPLKNVASKKILHATVTGLGQADV